MKTILFGFMPFPCGGTGIPIYKNPSGLLVCHTLSEDTKSILNFDGWKDSTQKPEHMIELPEQLRFPISVGDPPIWIFTFGKNPSLDKKVDLNGLFIGTVDQLRPYEEILRKLLNKETLDEVFGEK